LRESGGREKKTEQGKNNLHTEKELNRRRMGKKSLYYRKKEHRQEEKQGEVSTKRPK
jgi:hypothetical protein